MAKGKSSRKDRKDASTSKNRGPNVPVPPKTESQKGSTIKSNSNNMYYKWQDIVSVVHVAVFLLDNNLSIHNSSILGEGGGYKNPIQFSPLSRCFKVT
jgi:hypothetical protein